MTDRILLVDDDANVLQGYQRALRKQFILEPALSGEEALEAVRTQGPYAVVVADMRMPGMNGVELLARIKNIAPNTVRIMLTGNADQQTALEAVNEGYIFRFLTKPCPPDVFSKVLQAGLDQYRLIMAERELLANTLRGSVEVLTDILSLVNPVAFARTSRVRRIVNHLNQELQVEDGWLFEIAAMLSQIGCVAVPEEILQKLANKQPLSNKEREVYAAHPETARSLLSHIPRLEEVIEIITHQNDCYVHPDETSLPQIPERLLLGSRILKVALDWDNLTSSGMEENLALAEINERKGDYDPRVFGALHQMLCIQDELVVRRFNFSELPDGVVLAEDVVSIRGTLLCAKGQEVTPSIRARLKNYVFTVGVQGPIKVFVSADRIEHLHTDSHIPVKPSGEDPLRLDADFLNSLH
jgi:response regulator RpfG family c-di-GMP phosphodiesterase